MLILLVETVLRVVVLGPRWQPAQVFALMAGSYVNSDGRSATITAPNGTAQQRLVRAVLALGSPQRETKQKRTGVEIRMLASVISFFN